MKQLNGHETDIRSVNPAHDFSHYMVSTPNGLYQNIRQGEKSFYEGCTPSVTSVNKHHHNALCWLDEGSESYIDD